MGQAQSMEYVCGDVGFLPKYHLMKVHPIDMQRLFLPRHLVARCDLYEGATVTVVDCLDRVHLPRVHSSADVYFLGTGWPDFVAANGIRPDDFVMFEFTNTRACKATVFESHGPQKYPAAGPAQMENAMRRTNAGHRWPQMSSPHRAIAAGPCTRSYFVTDEETSPVTSPDRSPVPVCRDGREPWYYNAGGLTIDAAMKHMLETLSILSPKAPLYVWKLTIHDLARESMVFRSAYTMAHIKPLMKNWDQFVYLGCGSSDRVPAKLSIGFDNKARISDGWAEFVGAHALEEGTKCAFKIDKFGQHITILVYAI